MYQFQSVLTLLQEGNIEMKGNEEGGKDIADLFNLSNAALPESQLRSIS